MIRNLKWCRVDQQNENWLKPKNRYMCTYNSKQVKPKTKHIKLLCVCVNLSISMLSIFNTRSKQKHKPKSSCKTLSSSRLDPNTIQ